MITLYNRNPDFDICMCASFFFKFPQVFLAFLAISDLCSGFVYHKVKVISLINITQYNIILVVLYEVEFLTLISCHHISDFVSQWQLVYEGKNEQWAFWCCPCNSLRLSRWMDDYMGGERGRKAAGTAGRAEPLARICNWASSLIIMECCISHKITWDIHLGEYQVNLGCWNMEVGWVCIRRQRVNFICWHLNMSLQV